MEDEKIKEILNKYPKNEKSNLIQILNEFQERDGYISEQVMLDISKHLGITLAAIHSQEKSIFLNSDKCNRYNLYINRSI